MRKRRGRRAVYAIAAVCGLGTLGPVASAAAEPPQIGSVAVEGVSATGATLHASVNPKGSATTYRFEYLDEAAYEGNLDAGREPFTTAAFAPVSGVGLVGAGSSAVIVSQHLTNLAAATAYRYRLRVVNAAAEVTFSTARPFGTQAGTNAFELLDHRGWELVSPVAKNGGAIQAPGSIFGGGVFQAASGGGAVTYSSTDAFGAGAQGAPPGSQYLSTLGAGAWATANVTTPILSGSYGDKPLGVPYQAFSPSLGIGLLSNGERCRGEAGGECPVANPAIPGSGAPAGYRDYYLRDASGGFTSLLTAGDLAYTSLGPSQFELLLVAATPELDHVIVSSCAALTPDAIEVAAPGGCDAEAQNLYEWSAGTLTLLNVLPGQSDGTPGATVGAAAGAVSEDGGRVYFELGDALYLREGGTTKLVDESTEPPEFEAASSDGGVAFLLDGANLYRYLAAAETLTPLTTGGEVEGVLGVAPDGSRVYWSEPSGLFLREGGVTTRIAGPVTATSWPPATGSARVSADGRYLLFVSAGEPTGYPSEGETEVFLYGPAGAAAASLTCVSCNPTGERPRGGSTIPGAFANGTAAGAFDFYKPRVLTPTGTRVFFETEDSLVAQDTNGRRDVYEWEAAGSGTCEKAGGCIQLISTGRSGAPSTFLDASADASDAFFLTAESIDPIDPGSDDVYDARVGGGFVVPSQPTPCDGDACQVLPEAPEDPSPGTMVPNSGNPPLQIAGETSVEKPKKHHKKKSKRRKKKSKKAKSGSAEGRPGQKKSRKGGRR